MSKLDKFFLRFSNKVSKETSPIIKSFFGVIKEEQRKLGDPIDIKSVSELKFSIKQSHFLTWFEDVCVDYYCELEYQVKPDEPPQTALFIVTIVDNKFSIVETIRKLKKIGNIVKNRQNEEPSLLKLCFVSEEPLESYQQTILDRFKEIHWEQLPKEKNT